MQGGEGPWNCTGLSPMRSDIAVVQETAARGARSAEAHLRQPGGGIKGGGAQAVPAAKQKVGAGSSPA
ncbi:MAG TPA: hypothetical protein VK403_08715 [Allosphingosinicella sp.]|nr:hypothetical protein [Allosphingosinicella sp.]